MSRLATDLVSGDPARVRRALELPVSSRLTPQFIEQMHTLHITFDLATALDAGENQVTVDAEVTSPRASAARWRVTLDRVRGRYVVADTRPVGP